MRALEFDRAVLVYQAGIANVFRVNSFDYAFGVDRGEARLIQADFRTCENFARGLAAAGVIVRVASCNRVGDVALHHWSLDLDDCLFRDRARPNKAWFSADFHVA